MKPLIRWTVGTVTRSGLTILELSVRRWHRLYEDRFDMTICYNNLSPKQLDRVAAIGLPLVNQQDYARELVVEPKPGHPCWKLYPPRLRKNAHEIVIDNDLVVYRHLDVIEEFLNSNFVFVTEAIGRANGRYDQFVKSPINVNTGMYGMPPLYDLQKRLNQVLSSGIVNGWEYHLDEQGLLALIFTEGDCRFITLDQIAICHPQLPLQYGSHGMHFIGVNRGFDDYWQQFVANTLI